MKNNEVSQLPFPTMKSLGGVKSENSVSSKVAEAPKAEEKQIGRAHV